MKAILLLTTLIVSTISFSQELRVGNAIGQYYQGNNRITKEQFEQTLSSNQYAYDQFKSSRITMYSGLGVGIIGVSVLGWNLGKGDSQPIGYIMPSLLTAGGIATYYIGLNKMKGSINLFNESKDQTYLNIHVGVTSLTLTLNL